MEYENYIMWMNLSYEEFRTMMESMAVNVLKSWVTIIAVCLVLFLIYVSSQRKYKLDPESRRKLKQICKWEKRPVRYQVKHILEMYIDAYTEKNKIDWEQRLY